LHLDREKILEAARVVFGRHGYRKASLADLVRPLGVAKTAIYHHFPRGKEEIFRALIDREEGAVLGEMEQAVASVADPRHGLRALFLAKVTHFQELRRLLCVPRDVGEEVAALYGAHGTTFRERERSLIAAFIRRGQEEGLFRPGDPDRLARTVQSVLNRQELALVFEETPEVMTREVDELLDLILYGIMKEGYGDD